MNYYAPDEALPVDGPHRWLAVQPDRKMPSDEAEFGGITPRFVLPNDLEAGYYVETHGRYCFLEGKNVEVILNRKLQTFS